MTANVGGSHPSIVTVKANPSGYHSGAAGRRGGVAVEAKGDDVVLDDLSREYVSLAFAIERLSPGFVDAHVGAEEIKAAAESGPTPDPAALLTRIDALRGAVASGTLPEDRQAFLMAQTRAMATVCGIAAGENIAYLDEVRGYFDIEPRFTPELVFDTAIDELDALLPGEGDVASRLAAWRKGFVIPPETARRVIGVIMDETRRRTEAFAPLPEGETVEIAFVSDKPWSGYNWYLGGNRSRVEVNTDLPIHAHELTALIAHEAYPGHHTEHSIKERVLLHERGYGEHAVQLINTPQCVVSEGIATLAESIVFPGEEGARWQAETLYPAAGIRGDASQVARIAHDRIQLRAVSGNAAILFHAEGATEEEAVAYLMRYGLRTEPEARQSFRFIKDPLWRAYVFTYHVGRDLLTRWLDGFAETERQSRFAGLLESQTTPSRIEREIAGRSTPTR